MRKKQEGKRTDPEKETERHSGKKERKKERKKNRKKMGRKGLRDDSLGVLETCHGTQSTRAIQDWSGGGK